MTVEELWEAIKASDVHGMGWFDGEDLPRVVVDTVLDLDVLKSCLESLE